MKARFQDAALCKQSVENLYVPDVIAVSTEAPLRQVIELMQQKRIGAIVVESNGKFKATFSERDVVERVLGEQVSLESPVGDFLPADPVYVFKTDEVGKAMNLLVERNLRHLAVCDDEMQVKGIISVRNIIDCLAQQFPAEVLNQPPRGDQKMRAPEGG